MPDEEFNDCPDLGPHFLAKDNVERINELRRIRASGERVLTLWEQVCTMWHIEGRPYGRTWAFAKWVNDRRHAGIPQYESHRARRRQLFDQYERAQVEKPRAARLCEIKFWEARPLSADEEAFLSRELGTLLVDGMDIVAFFEISYGADKRRAMKSIVEQRKSIERRKAKIVERERLLQG